MKTPELVAMPQIWADEISRDAPHLDSSKIGIHMVGELAIGPAVFIDHWFLETVIFIQVTSGEMLVETEGNSSYKVQKDGLTVLFPGRITSVRLTASKNNIAYFSLSGEGIVSSIMSFGLYDRIHLRQYPSIAFFPELLKAFHASGNDSHDPIAVRLVERILMILAGHLRNSVLDRRFFDALKMIHTMPRTSFTASEVAARLGVSRVTLNTFFAKNGFPPPGEYIASIRAVLAQEMLVDGKLSIAETARQLGFSCPTAFTTFFRRRTGMTPGKFRHYPSKPHRA